MRDAAVGFHCPDCVKEGSKAVRTPRTIAGGRVPTRDGAAALVLIGINVAVYLAQVATGDRQSGLYEEGILWPYGVASGDWWRLLTSAFLHLSITHIAFNMVTLYLFGPPVERVLGTLRFVVAYLTTALVASVAVMWLSDPAGGTAGASGAIYGLFGLALVMNLRRREDVRGLLVLLAIGALMSLRGGISWQGHLGGFVAGLLVGAAFLLPPRRHRTAVQVASVVLLVAGSVAAVVVRSDVLLP